LLGGLSLLTVVFVGLAIFIVLEDYYNYFLDDIALLAFLVAILPALLLGFYSKAKNFLKIITVSGLLFLLGIIGIMAIYLLSENLYKDSFSLLVSIIIVVVGFVVFVFLPRTLVKWSLKKESGRKFLANAFAILSALSFAAWHFISENQLISQDDFGNTYESSLFNLYWLAVLLFRLMLAFEPPKNRLNLIIGLIIIFVSYII
jgi:FlaA1/EpsC-like NDP-sugar epimerase